MKRSRPCLFSHQLILSAQVHVRRQVLTSLTAQRTAHHDGPERERLYAGGHIPPTAFALNHEQLAFLDSESHQSIIGEYKANMSTGCTNMVVCWYLKLHRPLRRLHKARSWALDPGAFVRLCVHPYVALLTMESTQRWTRREC